MTSGQATDDLAEEVCAVSKRYGRVNWAAVNAVETRKAKEAKAVQAEEPAQTEASTEASTEAPAEEPQA